MLFMLYYDGRIYNPGVQHTTKQNEKNTNKNNTLFDDDDE